MNKLTRDIRLTLMVKFVLLIILWVVCFKGADKNKMPLPQWLYGADIQQLVVKDSNVNTFQKEVKHDSR